MFVKKMKKQPLKEIILHVGLHKTATSSIQRSLADKLCQKLLTSNEVLYPKSWPLNHSIPVYSVFSDEPEKYHINVRKKLTRDQVIKLNSGYLRKIEEEVASKNPSKLIISGEDISYLSVQSLQSLRDYLLTTFNPSLIRVVVYVRNPVSLSISKMQEVIKNGHHTMESALSIDLNSKEHSIKKRLIDIEQVFSRGNTEVYTFEDAVKDSNGPVGHFLSVIGFNKPKETAKFHIERSNEGLSLLAVNIISFINHKYPLFKDGVINEPRQNGDILPLTMLKGEKFDLTSRIKKELLHTYHDELIWLNDHCGIDYCSTIEEKDDKKKLVISSEQLVQLKEIHAVSSKIIQELIVEFLNEVAKDGVELPFSEFKSLLDELDKSNEADSRTILSEEQFRHALGINSEIDSAEVYREVALLLESYDEINAALVFMKKAAVLRPGGPFIKQKIEEYLLKK